MRVSILGAGAMGSAMAIPLSDNGHRVSLWGTRFDSDTIRMLRNERPHPALGCKLPAGVRLFDEASLAAAVEDADWIIIASNTEGMESVLKNVIPHITSRIPLLLLAKGLLEVRGRVRLLGSAVKALLRGEGVRDAPVIASMAGPSLAKELAHRCPTAVNLAAASVASIRTMSHCLETPYFSVQPIDDPVGLETCSGFKNIYSIALGWPAGLAKRAGETRRSNLKAILLLHVLHELRVLAEAGKGQAATVDGPAGLGDLVASAESGRNGRLGELIAAGKSVTSALSILRDEGTRTVEGYEAMRLGLDYVRERECLRDSDLPLLHAIARVLEGQTEVSVVVRELIKPAPPSPQSKPRETNTCESHLDRHHESSHRSRNPGRYS